MEPKNDKGKLFQQCLEHRDQVTRAHFSMEQPISNCITS